VVNSGFNSETGQRESVEGKAYFVGSPDIGRLRVSFFGPFYGGYNIIVLDKINYSYVMVAGPDRDYLWILSRTPKLDQAIVQRLLVQAKAQGFAIEDLIFDTHSSP
jgi:apolipoprotein D and lipocalin family protein